MRIIVQDVLTVTMNSTNEIDTLTLIIEDGKFESVTKKTVPPRRGVKVLHGKSMAAIPGLVNGHVHCDVTLARGLGDGLTLYEQDRDSFVSEKGWFHRELDREARHISRLLQYAE